MERTRTIFIAIFSLSFLAAIGVLMGLLWLDLDNVRAAERQATALSTASAGQAATLTVAATITPPATGTPTPTGTPPPDFRATTQAQATATAVAHAPALAEALQWAFTAREAFNNNANGWDTAPGDEALSKDDRSIADGKFIWKIESYDDFIWVEPLPESVLGDRFLVSLDIDQTMTLQNDQGLAFNYQDSDNYVLFSTCDEPGTVGAFRRVASEWLTMQSCRTVDAIREDGPNQLVVIGNYGYLQFFVNEQFVADLWDETHSGGSVGVYVEMDADQTNSFTFDNLEVRSPELGR